MNPNESYHPVSREATTQDWNGISIRNKLAHDYFCAALSSRKLNVEDDVDLWLNTAFELADKFIKKSQENGK